MSNDSKLTEEFRHIAGNKDIKVKWNAQVGHYWLYLKGKFIMHLERPITGNDRKRVKTHFRKLRSDWYRKNIKRKNQEMELMQSKENTYDEQQMYEESVEFGRDMLEKQSVWVTRP